MGVELNSIKLFGKSNKNGLKSLYTGAEVHLQEAPNSCKKAMRRKKHTKGQHGQQTLCRLLEKIPAKVLLPFGD